MHRIKIITLLLASAVIAPGASLETKYRTSGSALRDAFEPLQHYIQTSSAVIARDRDEIIYGTVVSPSGHILTKASELPESISGLTVTVDREQYTNPVLVTQLPDWDLALIKIEADGLIPVKLDHHEEAERGSWVLANGATTRRTRRVQIGVVAANPREVFAKGGTVLGVALDTESDKLKVKEITEGTGAEAAGIQKGDIIISLDGTEVKDMEKLLELLAERRVGDVINLLVQRDDKELMLEVELSARTDVFEEGKTRNDAMSGEYSKRRTGFPMVMQHDIMGSAETMGGPVFDLKGRCLGMNIARFSRCETYAIPAANLDAIVKDLLSHTDKP